ncbi:site-specific DNA-methyltransferase (adenine-specific) [Novosphingobium chloroacetimidivorans]|uniref:Methyltransferase n=1 Tax=Novosphingobium chloroacetimidivorans TaxID=1428314 RepID=A0A7W7KBI4_9SPHN|nr:site-specific DNA-methyltransferase [Novosphingobium chloroacetimidivorans]MBB4859441.1 site-specific DNA-methyltransferase (adenine-specific) [Novosphingobium chloroacetimidivorans]
MAVQAAKYRVQPLSLHHGNCLDVLPTIPDASVDAIICDLPYATTKNGWDVLIPFEPLWAQYRRVAKPSAPIILTAQQPFTSMLVASNYRDFRYELIWEKNASTGFLNAKKMPLKSHESILVFYKRLPTYNPQMTAGTPYTVRRGSVQSKNYGKQTEETITVNNGTRCPRSVLRFDIERGAHPTQKPVALMRYLIETFTNPGDVVLDNCMGSGTTGVASIAAGRQFIGIEQDAAYFNIAHERITGARVDQ